MLQRVLGVKYASDVRQVWTVATYYALLVSMFFVRKSFYGMRIETNKSN